MIDERQIAEADRGHTIRAETSTLIGLTRQRSWPLWHRLWREYLKEHRIRLVFAVVAMATIATASSIQTYLMGPLIDKVFIARDAAFLWTIAGGVLTIFIMRSIARYLQEVWLVGIGQDIVAKLQSDMAQSLLKHDIGCVEACPPATFSSSFIYDAAMVRLAVCDVFLVAGKDTLTVITMIGLMFFTDWRLALLSLFLPVIAILPMTLLGRQIRVLSLQTQEKTGVLSRHLINSFANISTAKIFGLASRDVECVRSDTRDLASLVVRTAWIGGLILPIVDGLGGLAIAAIITLGGTQVIAGALTPGELLVFVGAIVGAYAPIPSLCKVNATLQAGLAAAQRVFSLMDRSAPIEDGVGRQVLPSEAGVVRFENVRFGYPGGRGLALDGVNFEAPAGKMTALVGRTGVGKSSILKLIIRFYEADAGRVLVNGLDVRSVETPSLRAAVAMVGQEITLFSDSIAENIRCGRPGASNEMVLAAAAAAQVDEFAADLPAGLDTVVGEGGLGLSGGQRQRIAIARALLKDAPILLLDEATSAQDPSSERQIQHALQNLTKNRTTILVAHRLETIRGADLILVVHEGRIIEAGNHQSLLDQDGLYTTMCREQHAVRNRRDEAA